MPRGPIRRNAPKNNVKITNGPTTITSGGSSMTKQPRSFMDFLTGTSKVSYSRPAKAAPTQKSVNKAFKSYGPTSNGKGVGM